MPECLSKTKFKKVKPVVPVDIYPDIAIATMHDNGYDGISIHSVQDVNQFYDNGECIIIPNNGKYKISLDKEWIKKQKEEEEKSKSNGGK